AMRRECLDHGVVIGERHIREILSKYVDYYNGTRTHLSLSKDAPKPRTVQLAESGQSGEGAARRWTASRIPAAGGMRPIGRISGRHRPVPLLLSGGVTVVTVERVFGQYGRDRLGGSCATTIR